LGLNVIVTITNFIVDTSDTQVHILLGMDLYCFWSFPDNIAKVSALLISASTSNPSKLAVLLRSSYWDEIKFSNFDTPSTKASRVT